MILYFKEQTGEKSYFCVPIGAIPVRFALKIPNPIPTTEI